MENKIRYYRNGNGDSDGIYKEALGWKYYYLSDKGWVEDRYTLSKIIIGWGGDVVMEITEEQARAHAKLRGWDFPD